MKIRVDHDRALRVFDGLVHALKRKKYPYNIAQLPQDLLPEDVRRDPLLHARFLFYVCHFMRGAIDSAHAIRQLVALWYESPWMFDPGHVRALEVPDIRTQLVRTLDYHLDEIAQFWWENSARLSDKWRGDPRMIFKGVTTFHEAARRVANKDGKRRTMATDLFEYEWGFLGFQGKMVSMLAYFLAEAKLIRAIRDIPPAVDFHLLRVMFANRILVVEHMESRTDIRYDTAYPRGVEVVVRYLQKSNVSPVTLGDALWCLSQSACSLAPGNRCVGRRKGQERKVIGPDGRKVVPEFLTLDVHNSTHLAMYEHTCARCPAERTCEINVQSGAYYEAGWFRFRKRQKLPKRPALFDTLPEHPRPARYNGGKLTTPVPHVQLVFFGKKNEPDA